MEDSATFPPSLQERITFWTAFQTLRVWLLSGCAFGTSGRPKWAHLGNSARFPRRPQSKFN
jgi:hypothetical protein